MKTSMKVLKAMICRKVRQQQQEWEKQVSDRNAEIQKFLDEAYESFGKVVAKQPLKFFEMNRQPGYRPTFVENDAYRDRIEIIQGAAPKKLDDCNRSHSIEIAALDLHFYAPPTQVDVWKAFADKCDQGFLEEDMKGIVELLATL